MFQDEPLLIQAKRIRTGCIFISPVKELLYPGIILDDSSGKADKSRTVLLINFIEFLI